jgi:mRNA interferase MazF
MILVSVVPGTSGSNVPSDYPTQIRVPAGVSGLRNETVFRAFQITSLDSRRFDARPAGRLPGVYLEKLEDAVRFVLGMSGIPRK